MQELKFLFALIMTASAAPSPYYSIVETPTSRVEQQVLLSHQLQEPFRIQTNQVSPFSSFPQHHSPLLRRPHDPLLRGPPHDPLLTGSPHNPLLRGPPHHPNNQVVYYYPQHPHPQGAVNLHQLRQEWWQELWNQFLGQTFESEEQGLTSDESSGEDFEKNEEELPTSTQQPLEVTEESNKVAPKIRIEEEQPIDKSTESVNSLSPNQQYYVINSAPHFYGNFDAFHNPVSPIISLQELQPIRRTQEKYEKEQKTAPLPTSTTEATSTLRINVPDDDDDDTEIIEEAEESKSEQFKSSSKVEELKPSTQEKNEKKFTEDRDISDESSIAQAKPSGIAIAGNGGVASSKPLANAISGDNGLSVASPSATALAGDFGFGDNDDDRKKPRKPNLTVNAFRKTITY